MTAQPVWRELYAGAMLELDRASLQERIKAAQTAIRQAMEALPSDRPGVATEEFQEMVAALGNLQSLQRVEFRELAPVRGESFVPVEGEL
jgi:hypothetical protein